MFLDNMHSNTVLFTAKDPLEFYGLCKKETYFQISG